jgi:hypothetical protein
MRMDESVDDFESWDKEWAQSWAPYETSWGGNTPDGTPYQTGCEIESETFYWDGKKDPSKEISVSFQFMRQIITPTTFFFILVGISAVFPFGASAKGIDPPIPPVNNISTIVPVDPVNIDLDSRLDLDWTRLMRRLLPYGPNYPPTPPVGPVVPIDWSINYEEKWKGPLTWDNLTSQREETKVLSEQGNFLQCQLFDLNRNHNLLSYETRVTLSAYPIRKAIRENKNRYFDLQPTRRNQFRDPVGYRVTGAILEEYRNWRTCADTLSTAIRELRRG